MLLYEVLSEPTVVPPCGSTAYDHRPVLRQHPRCYHDIAPLPLYPKGIMFMDHRVRAAWLVVAILLTTVHLVVPSPVTAAPTVTATCYGTSCNGLNPQFGCWEGYVVVASIGRLERRYSPACNAYWGFFTSTIYEPLSVWMEDNPSVTVNHRYALVFSDMWASGRVCAQSATFSGCV